METDIYAPSDLDNSLHINLNSVRIFWDGYSKRNYFRVDEDMKVVKPTTNRSAASTFALITTPALHADGQFKIQYTSMNVSEISSLENNTPYEIEMKLINPRASQFGPYQLVIIGTPADQTGISFEVRGSSSTIP